MLLIALLPGLSQLTVPPSPVIACVLDACYSSTVVLPQSAELPAITALLSCYLHSAHASTSNEHCQALPVPVDKTTLLAPASP